MLYQRILTAIPLAAFVVWIIFFQPSSVFFYFVIFIVLISGYEWARLSGVASVLLRCLYAVAIAAASYAVHQFLTDAVIWMIYAAVLWWFGVSLYLMRAKPAAADSTLKPGKLLLAYLILPAAAFAMHYIHSLSGGADWLFYALSLVWIADIGAYFSGKTFGRNKLAPNISPGKTREGLLGAVIATSVYTVLVGSYYFELAADRIILLVVLSVVLTLVSVSGDLYISFLKREAGLKDSGNILPGHGGILDRIDSVLAAMPVFLVGFNLLMNTAS